MLVDLNTVTLIVEAKFHEENFINYIIKKIQCPLVNCVKKTF